MFYYVYIEPDVSPPPADPNTLFASPLQLPKHTDDSSCIYFPGRRANIQFGAISLIAPLLGSKATANERKIKALTGMLVY